MSSSIIDFVNCHTEKELGNNKYINDKFIDVKELNGETIYQNNVLVATQTDIDFLQQEINSLIPDNPAGWINTDGITSTSNRIPFTDGTPNGLITSNSLTFVDNNIITDGAVILNNGKALTLNNNFDSDNIKLYKDNVLDGTFFIDNQTGSKTTFKGANSYNFDNSLSIGDLSTSKKIFLNGVENVGISAGLLRAINCNNFTPTTVYNIVWSNLTAQEQLEWKGLDPTTIDPVQSATGNYWNFSKSLVNTNKIGWYIPVDLSGLTFQDLESFWCVIRFNNNTNLTTEGSIYFSIYTNPPTAPNYYRTRINYSNPATAMNQTGYFYKIYALDTITTTTTANFGRAQEVGQQKFKLNPMNVRSDLWSIPFNKILAPAGDLTTGYTTAPIQSISLHTNSSSTNFNFDVVSIGYLDKQYNLFYS
jgi:hypothetical protein